LEALDHIRGQVNTVKTFNMENSREYRFRCWIPSNDDTSERDSAQTSAEMVSKMLVDSSLTCPKVSLKQPGAPSTPFEEVKAGNSVYQSSQVSKTPVPPPVPAVDLSKLFTPSVLLDLQWGSSQAPAPVVATSAVLEPSPVFNFPMGASMQHFRLEETTSSPPCYSMSVEETVQDCKVEGDFVMGGAHFPFHLWFV
jgi:hypothetical protein